MKLIDFIENIPDWRTDLRDYLYNKDKRKERINNEIEHTSNSQYFIKNKKKQKVKKKSKKNNKSIAEELKKNEKIRYAEAKKNFKLISYKEYLESQLWQEIRSRVLKRDGYKCKICKCLATCVHHKSYT